ncbi:hypothetical protein TRVL_08511 [Trypanosoma vivax]|uniref:Flagellar attachment zone protein 1 conserved domain-containing protein n=1 Tax=Trypanosoma vivax (strain Y486) TaxID=1055687 RepID=G0TU85_TRYVY|nr:hypothetical protein TRVL_08511 [Trypanosoma vivax]CCC47519.1 conserved hypothetical protein [Trypanosoma vivax Y486]
MEFAMDVEGGDSPAGKSVHLSDHVSSDSERAEGMSSSSSSVCNAVVTTQLTKRFDGDDWGCVLKRHFIALCTAFVKDVACACQVAQGDVTLLDLRLGSLYVTFHVAHDADVSEEEIRERVALYPFREVMRLYQNRNAPPDGLDEALRRNAALQEEMKNALDRLREESAKQLADAKREYEEQLLKAHRELESREHELNEVINQLQAMLNESQEKNKLLEQQRLKAVEGVKRERERSEKLIQRNSELIAAIVQENKKEMEAKEREFEEQVLEKDVVIENLRMRLRCKAENGSGDGASGSPSPAVIADQDRVQEFAKLMGRMEEMALLLEKTQESETEARGEIRKLAEALKLSEEARQSDAVIYENNMLALKQQLQAFRDTKLAEDHQRRLEDARARRGANSFREEKTNETIVRQYETALENIIGTLQDRLTILREEHLSFLKVSEEETVNERNVLNEHEADNQRMRQTFRAASLTLQRVLWDTRDNEVPQLITELDTAAACSEKSRASVKFTMALLDSRLRSFSEQKEWMETHQQALEELMCSLRRLNKRAFERQLALMNDQFVKSPAP